VCDVPGAAPGFDVGAERSRDASLAEGRQRDDQLHHRRKDRECGEEPAGCACSRRSAEGHLDEE
jgi:hypothetical protein